jgi:rare lipoprotein A
MVFNFRRNIAAFISTGVSFILCGCVSVGASELGRDLKPTELVLVETGRASFYASFFEGRKTANGEIFSQSMPTAAHLTLPLGSIVMVKRRSNGRTVFVRINDRGPYVDGRSIDLSISAAKRLKMVRAGVVDVDIYLVVEPNRPTTIM